MTAPEDGETAGDGPLCVCGHPRSFHEHLRPGSDCGACGRAGCEEYRRPRRSLREWLSKVHRVR